MQMRVAHVTTYTYDGDVEASYSEARLVPLTSADQYVRRARLDVTPTPWSQEYRDYWGTVVTAFEVTDPHEELRVECTSVVDTADPRVSDAPISWADLADPDTQDEFCEFLAHSEATTPHPTLASRVESLRAEAAEPAELVTAVCDLVRDEITRLVGATHVSATAEETWRERKGVAQDLAHVAIGALRHAGVPARFVTGYRHPDVDPALDEPRESEPHGWLEWWDGSWVGHDVAFGETPGERHVVVSMGRDAGDSPPLRGIYATSGPVRTEVTVEITRIG